METITAKIDALSEKAEQMHKLIRFLVKDRARLFEVVETLQQENETLKSEIQQYHLQSENQSNGVMALSAAHKQEILTKIDSYLSEIDGCLNIIDDSVHS